MITVPEEGVFVTDVQGEATASIVLNTDPGYKFTETANNYNVQFSVKSIPNLKTENIVISNQFSEYFDLNAEQLMVLPQQ